MKYSNNNKKKIIKIVKIIKIIKINLIKMKIFGIKI